MNVSYFAQCVAVIGLYCVAFSAHAQDAATVVNGDLTVNGKLVVGGNLIVNGEIVVNGETLDVRPPVDGAPIEVTPDFFVELWELDQQNNGLSVTLRNADGDWEDPTADICLDEQRRIGNETDDNAESPIMLLHHATKTSGPTYEAVRKLFDNYSLKDNVAETVTEEEVAEQDAFLDSIMATAVIQRLLAYINEAQLVDEPLDEDGLRALLKKQWFELFTNHYNRNRPNRQVSGFEHVMVGDENLGGSIGGHHFWWKFLLDQQRGRADSVGHHYTYKDKDGNRVTPPGERYPRLATFGMRWKPETTPLYHPMKGFFLGCSPEFMIAHGTLALLIEKKTGKHQVISLAGGEFEVVIHAETNADGTPGDQIRSLFPALKTVESEEVISVATAAARSHGETVAVRGVITDAFNNQFGVIIKDNTESAQELVVKLESAFRDEFSPLRNPEIKGKAVVIHGIRGSYHSRDGVRDVFRVERAEN